MHVNELVSGCRMILSDRVHSFSLDLDLDWEWNGSLGNGNSRARFRAHIDGCFEKRRDGASVKPYTIDGFGRLQTTTLRNLITDGSDHSPGSTGLVSLT